MKRCHWCGRFVKANTEPLTFPNAHGVLVTQLHCVECHPSAVALGETNRLRLTRLQS